MSNLIDQQAPDSSVLVRQRRKHLAQLLREKARVSKVSAATSIAQRGVWYMQQMEPASEAYHISFCVRVTTRFNLVSAQAALQHLVDRHAMLRTTFNHTGDELEMQIHGGGSPDFTEVDASGWDDAELRRRAKSALREPFDLIKGPLVRMIVFSRNEDEHVLLLVLHHLICDGHSLGVILQEFIICYEADVLGQVPCLPRLDADFRRFVLHQHDWLGSSLGEDCRRYWLQQLSDDLPTLALPKYQAKQTDAQEPYLVHDFATDPGLYRDLSKVAQLCGATLFSVLLATFQVFLMRISGQNDMLVGVPMSGRNVPGYEGVVGHFVELAAIRGDLSGDPTFRELVGRCWVGIQGAVEHQGFPFLELVRILRTTNGFKQTPFFRAHLNILKPPIGHPMSCLLSPEPTPMSWGSLKISSFSVESMEEPYDLSFRIVESPHNLQIKAQYNSSIFTSAAMAHLSECFIELLKSAAADPGTAISKLKVLPPSSRSQIVETWNATRVKRSEPALMHGRLSLQAELSPDATALVFEDQALTYAQLDQRSNQLARLILSHDLGRDDVVAICAERSIELVVAIIGSLKAGVAYVPIDPRYPKARIDFMLHDCGARLAVTTPTADRSLDSEIDIQRVRLHRDFRELEPYSAGLLTQSANADNLAYVIYTSGSTGRPKGVQISHGALANLIESMAAKLPISAADVLLSVTTFSFDIFGLELFLPLSCGARVELASESEVVDGQRLSQRLIGCGASIMQATPTTWRLLLAADYKPSARFTALCGGESLDPSLAQRLLAADISLWNMYGPTETTIWSCIEEVKDADAASISIGRPIANTQAYVLDRHLEPVPIGVVGTLYLGGDGVARGYVNRPELTAEKFVPCPFQGRGFIYDTGDLARFLPDGRLECLGRVDHQVKLRGYRISLEEIEIVLAEHPDVEQAFVILGTENIERPELVAYYRRRANALGLASDDLRLWLRRRLPDYMIPSAFVLVEAFPLMPNGKIDRKALVKCSPLAHSIDKKLQRHGPAFSPTEQFLVDMWQTLIGIEDISIDDIFFEIGGHSLLAAQMFAKLEAVFRRPLPIALLFEAPTIRLLARAIDEYPTTAPGPNLFTFRVGDGSPPLIMMPSMAGTVLHWRAFVALFQSNRPFCGIYMNGEPNYQEDTTLEEVAMQCAKVIAAAYPDKPCHLFGFSFGGTLAFEVARQLRILGCDVGVTAILDKGPMPFGSTKGRPLPILKNLFSRMLGAIATGQIKRELTSLRWILRLARRKRSVGKEGVAIFYMFGDKEIPDRSRRILAWNINLESHYQPRPYDGDLLLIRASRRPLLGPFEPDLGWKEYVRGTLSVADIEGGHAQMIETKHLTTIAEILSNSLQEYERAAPKLRGSAVSLSAPFKVSAT